MRQKGTATATRKQELVSQFRKGEILDAARRVFARKGFEAALVDDIAMEAGIAKGTVYLYFRSKTDIYRAALHEDLQALAALKREAVAAVSGARAKLHAYVEATLAYCERRRDFFRIFLVESGRLVCSTIHPPEEMQAISREQVSVLVELVKEAGERGEIRAVDAESAGWVIGTAIKGVIERRLIGDGQRDASADADLIVDIIWNGLAPRGPAKKSRPAKGATLRRK